MCGPLCAGRRTQVWLSTAVQLAASPSGERRVITLLFYDVKGSSAMAEQLDPEEWAGIIKHRRAGYPGGQPGFPGINKAPARAGFKGRILKWAALGRENTFGKGWGHLRADRRGACTWSGRAILRGAKFLAKLGETAWSFNQSERAGSASRDMIL